MSLRRDVIWNLQHDEYPIATQVIIRKAQQNQAVVTGPPSPGKTADYVGRAAINGRASRLRAFRRWLISDLPGAVTAARLEWFVTDKHTPTEDVALIEIADFGTLDISDWGLAERATINAAALTPATAVGETLSLNVTTRYNQAKTDGLTHFAVKLQPDDAEQGWYRVGMTGDWAPTLVLTITAGKDVKLTLLATPVAAVLDRADDLGDVAACITAGDTTYPPLGPDVVLGATLDGIQDDADGTYTGVPDEVIERMPDILHALYRSPDIGCGMAAHQIDLTAIETARTRLVDWFPLAGGLTQVRDVREWAVELARSARALVYVDQEGRESVYVEPIGGTGVAPTRLVQPHECGALRLLPSLGMNGALYPISRLEVFYGLDYLGVETDPWRGHVLIAPGETEPADAQRDAEAVDATARYGERVWAEAPQYPWVPLDTPEVATGVRLSHAIWDRARTRPTLIQRVEVQLPRFALGWRLFDEFWLESYHFPSGAARVLPTATAILGVTDPGTDVYQCRRARCQVRELPVLLPESGPEFPVLVVAEILGWETP